MKLQFQLVNIASSAIICYVEIDKDDFINNNIVDPNTNTFKHICAAGKLYTILPIANVAVSTFAGLKAAYDDISSRPMARFRNFLSVADNIMDYMDGMFKNKQKFYIVKTQKDMEVLINPKIGELPDFVEYSPYDEIMKILNQEYLKSENEQEPISPASE